MALQLSSPSPVRQCLLVGSKLFALGMVFLVAVTLFPSGKPDAEAERNGGAAERSLKGLSGDVVAVEVADTELRASDTDVTFSRESFVSSDTEGLRPIEIDVAGLAPEIYDAELEAAIESGEWIEPVLEPESQWVDGGNGVRLPDVLLRIRFCESTNNYGVANNGSSARGAYQFLTKSWEWYGHAARYGVARAHLATPAQQDEAALLTYQEVGARPWAESRPCWGSDNIDPRYLTARPPVTTPPTDVPQETTTTTAGGESTTTTESGSVEATTAAPTTTAPSTTAPSTSSTTTSSTTAAQG